LQLYILNPVMIHTSADTQSVFNWICDIIIIV